MALQLELALNPLGESYRILFERSPLPMLVYDVNTLRLLAANLAAASCYGCSIDELIELRWSDLHHEVDLPQAHRHLQLLSEERGPWRHRRRGGELIYVELDTEDVQLDGICTRMVLVRDVTQKLLAEQKAKTEHETLAAVINASNDAVITTDTEGRIQIFNPGAEHLFGISQDSMQGQSIEMLMPVRFRLAHIKLRRHFVESPDSYRMMGLKSLKGLRSDGQEIDLEGRISQVKVDQDPLLICILRDVTARVRTDSEREQSRMQLSKLANKLMLQEKELIKRLARALHDHLGQTLATIGMVHEAMSVMHKGHLSSELARLDQQLERLIKQAIHQVRQVLTDLHPPILDEHGLAAALDNELRNRSLTAAHIKVVLDVQPHLTTIRWPAAIEYAAFMIAREAVENAFRHSRATLVTVRLCGTPLSLQLDVLDNGVGFAVDAKSAAGHLGMVGMRERAKSIDASLELSPPMQGGAQVSLRWESLP